MPKYYTIDGHKPAPYPDMTDAELEELKVQDRAAKETAFILLAMVVLAYVISVLIIIGG